ncbi:hypothetical protein CLAIMM_01084, partial [Cladophialophora immunda]
METGPATASTFSAPPPSGVCVLVTSLKASRNSYINPKRNGNQTISTHRRRALQNGGRDEDEDEDSGSVGRGRKYPDDAGTDGRRIRAFLKAGRSSELGEAAGF